MRLSVPRLGKADRCGASSPKVNGCTQDVPAAIVISTFQKSPSYNSYKKLRAQNRTYDCVRFRAYLVDFSYGLLPLCFAMETAKADPPYQGGLMLRIEF